MDEHIEKAAGQAEQSPAVTTRDDAYKALSALGVDDLGDFLLTLPNKDFPKLSALLPGMAGDDIQRRWTGACGRDLLRQTSAFVRIVAQRYAETTGRPLSGARMLDFGCGYGRIARLMYAYTPESRFYAVDPWDRSIELCREQGLSLNYAQSDYLPESLPVGDARFDLIYAFSVFTHLSPRAFRRALTLLPEYLAPGGVLVITIRPVEYWAADMRATRDGRVEEFTARHRETGFAFNPHEREAVDGDITYGDTSTTVEYIRREFPRLAVRAVDRSLTDLLQRYVFLTRI